MISVRSSLKENVIISKRRRHLQRVTAFDVSVSCPDRLLNLPQVHANLEAPLLI